VYHCLFSKLLVEIFFILILCFIFFFPERQVDAAKELGISLATLKAACRRLGLSKWPFEKEADQVMGVVLCALSFSLSHKHMHIQALLLNLGGPLSLSLSLSLSLCLSH